jgi:hypothetical protein
MNHVGVFDAFHFSFSLPSLSSLLEIFRPCLWRGITKGKEKGRRKEKQNGKEKKEN